MKTVVLRGGPPVHPLVYSKRVLRMDRGVRSGDLVRVVSREGQPGGYAFVHTESRIALRMLSFDDAVVPDDAWFRDRIHGANALRTDVLGIPQRTNAWRCIHAEADGLPGLMVDRYGPVAVCVLYALGWYQRIDHLAELLREVLGVETVLWRPDPRTAEMEGIPAAPDRKVDLVEVHEDGVQYVLDPLAGHKSGLFLDQRDARGGVMRIARGRDVFDGMTYAGGFALAAAKGGARSVLGMDLDEDAVAMAQRNAARNDLDAAFAHGDVFDHLRRLAGEAPDARPDLLIVDPPKWARDRKGVGVALARYGDLNRLAFQAVRPGGLVYTHSCSGLVDEPTFLSVLRNAALDVKAPVRVLHVGGAATDHPVALHVPEGRYLKSVLLEVGPLGAGPGRMEGRDERSPEERGDDRGHGGSRRGTERGRPFDRRGPRRPPRR